MHDAALYVVHDGQSPACYKIDVDTGYETLQVVPGAEDVIYNYTDACRNLGFLAAARHGYDIYISLDDDVLPIPGTDPIGDHINALDTKWTPDWMSTSPDYRMRGVPLYLRKSFTVLSHGVWTGVPDFDAITQLEYPDIRDVNCYRGLVSRGVYFPVCAMNFAFRHELMPWVYQAPQGPKLADDGLPTFDRFADIWGGIVMKYAIDNIFKNAAAVTGYSTIHHARASNVWANLRKEAPGMELNETFYIHVHEVAGDDEPETYAHPYLQLYRKKLKAWQKLISQPS